MLQQFRTVNGDYYLDICYCLLHRFRRIRTEYREQDSWTFMHHNAPSYRLRAVFDVFGEKSNNFVAIFAQFTKSGTMRQFSIRYTEIGACLSITTEDISRSFDAFINLGAQINVQRDSS